MSIRLIPTEAEKETNAFLSKLCKKNKRNPGKLPVGRGRPKKLKPIPHSDEWIEEQEWAQVAEITRKKPKIGRPRTVYQYETFLADIKKGITDEQLDWWIEHMPEFVKKKIKNDRIFFARDILGYKWDGKEGFMNPPDPVHVEMNKLIDAPERLKLGLFPRGTYKSTFIAIIYPVWLLCTNPEITITIVGENWEVARKRLKVIKAHLEHNVRLIKLYGAFKPLSRAELASEWNSHCIYINQRTRIAGLEQPSIDTAGLKRDITGQHPKIIIIDDPVTDKNVKTFEQMQKTTDYVVSCIHLASKWGSMIMLGTVRKKDDAYGYVISDWLDKKERRTGGKLFCFYKMPVWDHATRSDPIMPSKYDEDTILDLYDILPRTEFAAHYLLDPSAEGATLINLKDYEYAEYLENNFDYNEDFEAYVCVDPGRSLKAKKCFTGIVLGIPRLPYDLYVDYARRIRAKPDEIMQELLDLVLLPRYLGKIKIIAIENNAFQMIYEGSMITWLDQKAAEYDEAGEKEIARALRGIQVIGVTAIDNKDDRIYKMEPYYRHQQIHVRAGLKDFKYQATNYPNIGANNRDLLDAHGYFPEVLGRGWIVNPFGIIKPKDSIRRSRKSRRWVPPQRAGDEDDYMDRGIRAGVKCY